MRRLMLAVLLLASMPLVFPSCVAKKKYLAARNSNADLVRRNDELSKQVTDLNDSVAKLRNSLDIIRGVYNVTNEELSTSKDQIMEQQKRLQQLQNYISAQQRSAEELRKKMAEALINFKSNELSVFVKNGKVYVSMQESLLFPSGSAVISQTGKLALAKVAGVLNTTDVNVEVEGHTDNKPIKTKVYPDNWALSLGRANSIAHVLIDEYTVSPLKIKASGRGEFEPIATNATDEGRQKNRRTEVILEPKLDELMNLIYAARP
jgi:chemotaxis protein MotB